MIFSAFFLGVPLLGIGLYLAVILCMADDGIPNPPVLPLFFAFAAYGAALLFVISDYFRVWSGMHSVALLGLLFVGLPLLMLLGARWRHTWRISAYHRAAVSLCFALPAASAALIVAFAVTR